MATHISSPQKSGPSRTSRHLQSIEGLNARADINFDSQVNAEDLGIMLAAWGDAPRNDYPPSDCPLGLIP